MGASEDSTFPTLNQEANLGFDVAFNTNVPTILVFLQYKVSVKLIRKNATDWDMFNNEYYRFKIYPESKSNQHNLLMNLAGLGHSVYYCAPAFIEKMIIFDPYRAEYR